MSTGLHRLRPSCLVGQLAIHDDHAIETLIIQLNKSRAVAKKPREAM